MGAFSGGVAPGYLIDPLRGSGMGSAYEFFRSLFSPTAELGRDLGALALEATRLQGLKAHSIVGRGRRG